MRFDRLLAQFITARRACGVSPKTLEWYSSWGSRFLTFLEERGHDLTISTITAQSVWEFLAELRDRHTWEGHPTITTHRPLSPFTVNGAYRALHALFKWAEQEGFVDQSPMSTMKTPQVPRLQPPAFSRGELRRLVEEAGKTTHPLRDQVIVFLLADCGLRLGELAGLRMEDIHLDEGYVKVMGKGAKERPIPLGDVTGQRIVAYLEEERPETSAERLLVTDEGKPLSKGGIRTLIRRLGKRAGLKARVYPHKLRHTAAREFLRNGGNVFTLQEILGHETLEMTRRYVYLDLDDLKTNFASASPMDNLVR